MPTLAQDGLQFWCQPQTSPGFTLHVGVERVRQWDEKGRAWKVDPAPLGNLAVAVYRCEPKGEVFRTAILEEPPRGPRPEVRVTWNPQRLFQVDPPTAQHRGNVGLPVVTTFGDPGRKRKEKRGNVECWVWDKQVPLLAKDRVAAFECPADPDKGFQVPAQQAGTYILEIRRGEERAYLPWQVSSLTLQVEAEGDQVRFSGVDAGDGSPLHQGTIKVRIQSEGAAGGGKAPEREETLSLDGLGHASLTLGQGQTLLEAVLQDGGQSMAATLGLHGRFDADEARRRAQEPPCRAFVFTDRPVYKPGDEVFLKILLDAPHFDPREDLVSIYSPLRALYPGMNEESWLRGPARMPVVADPSGGPWPLAPEGLGDLGLAYSIMGPTSFGTGVAAQVGTHPLTFSGCLKLPGSTLPGSYTVAVTVRQVTAYVTFEVHSYGKPRFSLRFVEPVAVAQPYLQAFAVEVKALDGSPVPLAHGEWNLFRIVRPHEGTLFGQKPGLELVDKGNLESDVKGTATFQILSRLMDVSASYRLLVKVSDAAGQRRMVSRALGNGTGGLRVVLDRHFSLPGRPVQAKAEQDGGLRSLHMAVYKAEPGEEPFWSNSALLRQGSKVVDLEGQGGTLNLPAGAYLVVAEAMLPAGGKVEARQFLLVADEAARLPASEALRVSLDGSPLLPGGTARVLVLLPREGLTLRWHVEGTGFHREETRKIPGTTALISIPLEEGLYPNGWVTVSTACDGASYERTLPLELSLDRDRLRVAVNAGERAHEPGMPAQVSIEVSDAKGDNTRSEVSLSVVDEDLFLLVPEDLRDPVGFFHPDHTQRTYHGSVRREFVSDALSREVLEPLGGLRHRRSYMPSFGNGGVEYQRTGGLSRSQELTDLRDHFLDTALWIPNLTVQGKTSVEVPLPDDPATLRATVVAFGGAGRAGVGKMTLLVSRPLQLSLDLPEALTEGDEGRALAFLVNHGTSPLRGTAHLSGEGADIPDGSKPFDLKPGEECRLAFRLTARAGGSGARIVATAEAEGVRDVRKGEFTIHPAGREVRAAGCLSRAAHGKELRIPFLAGAQGPVTLRLFAVDHALERLVQPSLAYVTTAPSGCVDHTVARFAPGMIIQDLVNRGLLPPLPGYGQERLRSDVRGGLIRLNELRKNLGGWGWYGAAAGRREISLHDSGQALWGLAILQQSKAFDGTTSPMGGPDWRPFELEQWRKSNPVGAEGDEDAAFYLYALAEASPIIHPSNQKPLDTELDFALKALDAAPTRTGTLGLVALTAALREHPALPGLLDRLEKAVHRDQGLAYWDGPGSDESRVLATVYAVKALCRARPSSPLIAPAEAYLASRFDGRGFGSCWATSQVLALLPDLAKVRRFRWLDGPEMAVVVEGRVRHDFRTGGNPCTLTVPAGRDVKVRIKGDGLLVWSQAALTTKAVSSPGMGDAALGVKRALFRLEPPLDGAPVGAGSRRGPWTGELGLGESCLMEVEVRSGRAVRYALVDIPVPAGLEADGRLEDFLLEGSPVTQIQWCRPEAHSDHVTFLIKDLQAGRPRPILLRLKARVEGRYRMRPVRFGLLGDESRWATSEGQDVAVGAERVK